MINLVLFGPPGAGKGTQSEKLIKKYGFVHISTGDLFRWHTKNDTPLGKRVKEIMNSGALVPDEITIAMLKEELDKNPQAKGFLFDGFPRTVPQAEALDKFMKDNGTAIHFIECDLYFINYYILEINCFSSVVHQTTKGITDIAVLYNSPLIAFFKYAQIRLYFLFCGQQRLNMIHG